MLTIKQWLVRQYGSAAVNINLNIVTKYTNTTPAKTKSINS